MNPETELRYARAVIWQVAQLGGESTKLAMQYIGWFAPINDKMSFEQIYEHLLQINEIWTDCTAEQWQAAIKQMLADKVSGSLKTPLTDHTLLEDYLALVQDSEKQPETPKSAYPANTRLTPKPDPPPITPYTPEQKARAAERLQQMRGLCYRSRRVYLSQ